MSLPFSVFTVIEAICVAGNHGPSAPDGLPGAAVPELALGPLVFRHVPAPRATGEIAGHLHPKATAPTRAGGVSRPCFVSDGRRVVMPAFGAFTGGLDVRTGPIRALFPRGGRAFLVGAQRLYAFPLDPRQGGPAVQRGP